MIGVSTVLYDLSGSVVINNSYINKKNNVVLSRRVSSVKTLDGGSFVSDFGHSETDDDIVYELSNLPKIYIDKLKDIVKLHSLLILTTPDGAFRCSMKRLTLNGGTLTLVFAIRGIA